MPTPKQQKVISKISENIGSKGELLRQSGYAESTSLTPHRILNGKGIQNLKDKAEGMGLNDDLTLSKVKKAVESNNLNLAINTIFNWWRVIYPNEKPDTQINMQINQYTGSESQEQEIDEYVIQRSNEMIREGKAKIENGEVVG